MTFGAKNGMKSAHVMNSSAPWSVFLYPNRSETYPLTRRPMICNEREVGMELLVLSDKGESKLANASPLNLEAETDRSRVGSHTESSLPLTVDKDDLRSATE